MMSSEKTRSPLLTKPTKCPCCGVLSPQHFFRTGMYYLGPKESDGHILEYRWTGDDIIPLHPPHYFVFWCPVCNFADISREFSDTTRNDRAKNARRAYQSRGDREREFLEFCANHIDYENRDFRSALILHFMAAYVQHIGRPDDPDSYKIGRLFMRAAWLYRENPIGPDAQGAFHEFATFGDFLKEAKARWAPLPVNEREAMQAAIPHMEHAVVHDEFFTDAQAYFTMLRLVVDLKKRCDDLNGAYSMIKTIYKAGADERNRCQNVIRDREASEDDKRRAKSKSSKINEYLRDVGELRHTLMEQLMERDEPLIQSVITRLEDAPPDEVKQALREKGLMPEQISRVEERGLIKKPKKRFIFF